MSNELRREWLCSACGVRVYKPGCKMPAPKGWRHSDDTCLRCQRSGEDPADAARKALLDGYCVADAWKIAGGGKGREGVPPKSAVRKWRAAYVEEGKLTADELAPRVDKGKPKRAKPKKRTKTEQAREALEAEPHRTTKEISKATGVSAAVVRTARRKFGIPVPEMDGRGRPVGA